MILASLSIEDLQQHNATLSVENLFLKEQLEWFKRQIFGKKSERVIGANQDQLQFEGFEQLSEKEVPTQNSLHRFIPSLIEGIKIVVQAMPVLQKGALIEKPR